MIKIDVWLTFSNGQRVLSGEILCQEPDDRGYIEGAFRYASSYLDHPQAFSLDPVCLPLISQPFEAERPTGIFSVFEDSLPDDWGRHLLVKKAGLKRKQQTVPHLLLALGANGLGALSYVSSGSPLAGKYYAEPFELEKLLIASKAIEEGEFQECEEIRALFRAGSSPGGARPKVLVKTEDGVEWVAKFPSIKDNVAVIEIEASTMVLAKKAGISVPECRILTIGSKKVFMVRRFDISETTGRYHMISMQTLLRADGWYNLGYSDIFQILSKISCQPEIDIPQLYRQMVFNAYVGNTDDHLKNFCMIHNNSGYILSPAYDLLPDIFGRKEHVLHFNYEHRFPGVKQLENLGKSIGITKPVEIIDAVRTVLSFCSSQFEEMGVPKKENKRFAKEIENRLCK